MQSLAVNIHIQCLSFQKTLLAVKKINRVVSSYPDHDRVETAEMFTTSLAKIKRTEQHQFLVYYCILSACSSIFCCCGFRRNKVG